MTFSAPNMLWLLAVLPGVWIAYELHERRRIARCALDYSYVATAMAIDTAPPAWRRLLWPVLLTVSAGIAIAGAARPEITIAETTSAADYVVVLDVSISMAADDVEPSRLEAAQDAALRFAAGLPDTSRLGLVLFSESAWVAVPLTASRSEWEAAIQSLTDDALVGGTRIGDAIQMAAEQFGGEEGAIVLVSDGNGDASQIPVDVAAQSAAERGVRVFTIGVGAESGVLEFRGSAYDIEYNPSDLRSAADSGDGLFFEAAEAEDFDAIYDTILQETSVTAHVTREITWLACVFAVAVVLFALCISLGMS